MIPLLDTLQSIPVLSFLPGVMVAMVALFPTRQLGVELGSILLIFTGQVWNMTFSVYSSMKSIPREMRGGGADLPPELVAALVQLELPYAAIGLIWNSMMSVAGGWFFLMACEMFVLGNRDLRLPGLGSYLQTAANAGDTRAILWGVVAMIAVIVLMDQLIWRPIIAWSEKFKFEQVEAIQTSRAPRFSICCAARDCLAASRPHHPWPGARSPDSALRQARRAPAASARGTLAMAVAVLGVAGRWLVALTPCSEWSS